MWKYTPAKDLSSLTWLVQSLKTKLFTSMIADTLQLTIPNRRYICAYQYPYLWEGCISLHQNGFSLGIPEMQIRCLLNQGLSLYWLMHMATMPQKCEDWCYSKKWAVKEILHNHNGLQEKPFSTWSIGLSNYQNKQAHLIALKLPRKVKETVMCLSYWTNLPFNLL